MSAEPTILVIDDDQKFSFGLVAVLRRAQYRVLTAFNGADGLGQIRAEKPDLILCDIMMPGSNGIQLKKSLVDDPQLGRIPFLFLTARTAPADKLVGLENGADDYITKPFEVNELLARIKSVLRREALGRQRGLEESAQALENMRRNISSNLSHEMRTPLTVLLATLDLVLRDKFVGMDQDLVHYMQRASSSAYRIKFLVEDLEFLNTLDVGGIDTLRQTIDLQFHFKNPIEQILKTWDRKTLNLQLNIAPGVIIYASRLQFAHVVSHLVDNACKFSPENGMISVSLRNNRLGGAIIEVQDEGPGIPMELREKVFERYYQISQGDTRQYSGLGLGLTVARAFAQAYGGEVMVLDSPTGCRVRMVLPPYNLD